MIRRRFAALIVVLAAVTIGFAHAQTSDPAVVLLEAAKQKETLDGDLRAAIKQYEAIVSTYGTSNRSVAAQALLRMAECYQKLGDPQARAAYERVVREFADRRDEVALARARLGTPAAATASGDRVVWTGPSLTISSTGRVSPDGRFITGRGRPGGALIAHDVAANVDRPLTPMLNPGVLTGQSTFSADGRQLLFDWARQGTDWRLELHIADWPQSGFVTPRRVLLGDRDDIPRGGVGALDWSPDGRWIAAAVRRLDGTNRIALLSTVDGSFRELKSFGWAQPDEVFFSPDSRYIAYDVHTGDTTVQHDVFVLAIDGSREIAAVVHGANDNVLGWSPDGKWLLFSSDRTGSWDLWGLRFGDDKAQGSPELLKSNIGRSFEGRTRSLGVTSSGALFVHKRVSSRDIVIAPIDLASGRLTGPPRTLQQGMVGGARNPVWSPDGKSLAYPADDGKTVAVRSVDSGTVRVFRTLSYANTLTWSPDGNSLLAVGTDVEGRRGLFRINVQSGAATRLLSDNALFLYGFPAQASPDGTKVFFLRSDAVIERDLASGAERDVSRELTGVGGREFGSLSPDGQYFTANPHDASTKSSSLLLVPVSGGQPRELLRVTEPETIERQIWTSDSRALIVERDAGVIPDGTFRPTRRDLWLIPVTGGTPRKLDIDTSVWTNGSMVPADDGFALSPDGRSIAFQIGKTVDEVWALEIALPSSR